MADRMLPFLALSSVGAAGASIVASAAGQNYLAKYLYNDIPRGAKPYPNIYELGRDQPMTNSTILGFGACAVVFGAVFVPGRLVMSPVVKALRRRYIYLPGTNFPRRITNVKGFLYDLCPDVVALSLPVLAAAPAAFAAKVYVEGPGRFAGFSKRYNPYTEIRKIHEDVFIYDVDRYVALAKEAASASASSQSH